MNQIVWYLFWEYAPIWLSQFWSFGIFWPQGPKVDQFNSLDYKQFRSKTMHLAPKYVPLWNFCEILVPRGLLEPKIGFNNHSPVQIWSLMKKISFWKGQFFGVFFTWSNIPSWHALTPLDKCGKKVLQTILASRCTPLPFRQCPKWKQHISKRVFRKYGSLFINYCKPSIVGKRWNTKNKGDGLIYM